MPLEKPKTISVRLKGSTAKILQKEAIKYNVSFSSYIRIFIEDTMKRHGLITTAVKKL